MMRLIHRGLTLPQGRAPRELVGFAALLVGYFVTTVVSENALNASSERLHWELRRSLLRQMFVRPLHVLERVGFPYLYSVLGGDVRVLSNYLCWLPNTVVNLAIVAGCFGYIAWLSPFVFVLNLAFVGIVAVCYMLSDRAAERISRQAADLRDRHMRQIDYAISASRLLMLNRAKRQDFLQGHFEPTGIGVAELQVHYRLVHLLAERLAEAMVLANVAGLLFVLPRYVSLSPATLTGLFLAAFFARAPLKSLLDVFPRTQEAKLSLSRIEASGLDAFAPASAEEPGTSGTLGFRELRLEGVEYRYESDHGEEGFSIGPLSFTVRAGEILFIVGGNGAGKTTLAKLLCGLYEPSAGRVVLDGNEVVTESARAALRELVAAVFNDDPLFSHLLGLPPDEAERRGRQGLEQMRLAEKVTLRGAEFSTTDLSQGQRRRISLMCALLENRPVLLLDEWAADQDPEFRRFFYESLLPGFRTRGQTVILITHDDRYFGLADRVIKLNRGQVLSMASG